MSRFASKLPLIRAFSSATTPYLARFGFTPNQVTTLGLLCGLGSAYCFLSGDYGLQVTGAVLFFFAYLFDYCDGELARLRGMKSKFGAHYDDFVDWVVHAAVFLALGYQAMSVMDNEAWMWMGAAAAIGGTINAFLPYALGGVPDGEKQVAQISDLGHAAQPMDLLIFAFRGLARADFWVIILGLALFNCLWVLLPAAAIGAQVYWLLYFKKSVRRILT